MVEQRPDQARPIIPISEPTRDTDQPMSSQSNTVSSAHPNAPAPKTSGNPVPGNPGSGTP